MLLKFTNHAQLRMHEREFSADNIKDVLLHPDRKKNLDDDMIAAWKKLHQGKTLKVVYKKDAFRDRKNEFIIISAYFID